jgi:ABC-type multidrug transport system fused ATPase/permease subunit
MNTLLRLLDISSGQVMVDQVDIATLSREEVRSRFVVIPQDSLNLSVSVRDYARLYGIAHDDDIIRGLKQAGLWNTIEKGGGLDMTLNDDNLSHGQRQLFSMTLACLRRGRVVLMDEPTSQ